MFGCNRLHLCNTHTDTYSYSDKDSYPYANCDTNCNTYGDSNSDRYASNYTYSYSGSSVQQRLYNKFRMSEQPYL